jgi:hypothetical protein
MLQKWSLRFRYLMGWFDFAIINSHINIVAARVALVELIALGVVSWI